MVTEAFIYDAVRTPRGRGRQAGALHGVKPVSLVAGLVDEIRKRNPTLDADRLADLVLGVGAPAGDQGGDLARAAALVAGLPDTVGGTVVNRLDTSGLAAVLAAAERVRASWPGRADHGELVLAGGVESMSRVPVGADGGPWPYDPATSHRTAFIPPGVAADLLATLRGFSRTDLDTYALLSRERAAAAWAGGHFAGSVVPVYDHGLLALDRDERVGPPDAPALTLERLAAFAPSFAALGEQAGFDAVALTRYHWLERIDHGHTAANSAGVADGAALVLVGDERAGTAHGLTARARLAGAATTGVDPTLMLTGAAAATRRLLERGRLAVDDVDLFEVNEPFAAVALAYQQDLGVPAERFNVDGGAIAMGHPVGATGAMLLGSLVDELTRRDARRGLVALGSAAGMGLAVLVERV
ncbi:MAG: acetyl-CoA C-acetyltransferase [Frankia sp.]|nr:acetyl-CoA C-acetyltransferase [Frankia sp.]